MLKGSQDVDEGEDQYGLLSGFNSIRIDFVARNIEGIFFGVNDNRML